MQLARKIFFILFFPTAAFAQATFSCPGNQYVTTQLVNTGQGCSVLPTAVTNAVTGLTGDVTAAGPGSVAASVVKVNGGTLPASTVVVGTNSSSQVVAVPSQATATVLAAPSGSAGVPTFRALVATDIPTIASTKVSGLAASATTDATNATNVTSGTLPAAQLPLATTGAFGAVKPDGTTITISAGVISSTGGSGGVSGLTAGQVGIAGSSTTLTGSLPVQGTGTNGVVTATLTAPAAAQLIDYNVACTCFINAGITTANLALVGSNTNTFGGTQTYQTIPRYTVASVASASTIAPTTPIIEVTGTTTVSTITAPSGTAALIGTAFDMVTDSAVTFNTGGNIFASFTSAAGGLYRCVFMGTTNSKWYCK